jgi:hypothetical protein
VPEGISHQAGRCLLYGEPLTSRNAVQAAYVNDETYKEIAPQRRTVRNLAEALGVDPTELVG